MAILREGELLFSFPSTAVPMRFDDAAHGLSHCMKAVDFIVEFSKFYLFVEVKDPDNTQTSSRQRNRFEAELVHPEYTQMLARKYRDSFLYRWAEKRLDKPVRYVILLQLSALQPAQYLSIDQDIKRALPISGTPKSWTRPLADGLAVLNMSTWNALGVYGTVRRVRRATDQES